jgi:hypothetical protein
LTNRKVVNGVDIFPRTAKSLICFQNLENTEKRLTFPKYADINSINSSHVEIIVLMSNKEYLETLKLLGLIDDVIFGLIFPFGVSIKHIEGYYYDRIEKVTVLEVK